MRYRLGFFVAVIALIGACSATPSQSPSTSEIATPAPATVAVTPPPTPEPTPRPTPTPDTSWEDFRAHLLASGSSFMSVLTKVSEAAGTGDFLGARTGFAQLEDVADTELEWLQSHAPSSCYASLQGQYQNAIALLRQAASTGKTAIDEFDADKMNLASTFMKTASSVLTEATSEISSISC